METNSELHSRNKCRQIKFKIFRRLRIELNPVVTLASVFVYCNFVILFARWRSENVPGVLFAWTWMKWITSTWTWLYIGTQDVWAIFMFYLLFTKYGKIKLGKPNEKPDFSDVTYFTMLFAAGVGVWLFYYGVAEPIQHYEPSHKVKYGNRYQGRFIININLTMYHWGIHGWVVYTMIGVVLGYLSHNKGMPLTMRTCFYPLVGKKIYGTLGDIIDTLSVVSTVFGLCTSLGAGAIHLNSEIHRLNSVFSDESREIQVSIIWVITAVATISVISGLHIGIRRLSEICFGLGMFIWFVIFFHGEPWYYLNVIVQSVGYYLQWIIQLGFHTDAFAQMGDAPDMKQAATWMNDWTIFYWGWWIAWSPFVGIFIARISRGRTVGQLILYTLIIPVVYCFIWFCVVGAVGLRMERAAANANITCSSVLGGTNANVPFNGLYRLSCRNSTDMWFDVMESYGGISTFLSAISVIAMILYLVTSSDSGSLVIDSLSANGHPDPPVLQRVFWALTEGATASVLVWYGRTTAVAALQSVFICSGLFYTIILNFVCVSIWRAFKIEMGEMDPNGPQFSFGLLDIFYKIPTGETILNLIIAIFAPWWPIGKAASKIYETNRIVPMLLAAIPFYAWAILELFQVLEVGLAYIGWAVLFGFFAYGTGVRVTIREKYGIVGNLAEDAFSMILLYPLAAMQMDHHMRVNDRPYENENPANMGNTNMAPEDSETLNNYEL